VITLLKMLYGTEDMSLAKRAGAQQIVLYYKYQGLVGSPDVIEWLLSGKPTSRAEWACLQVERIRRS